MHVFQYYYDYHVFVRSYANILFKFNALHSCVCVNYNGRTIDSALLSFNFDVFEDSGNSWQQLIGPSFPLFQVLCCICFKLIR